MSILTSHKIHRVSIKKANRLPSRKAKGKAAVYSQIHKKQINIFCGITAEIFYVKPGCTIKLHKVKSLQKLRYFELYVEAGIPHTITITSISLSDDNDNNGCIFRRPKECLISKFRVNENIKM
jgi:hypothetical protein